MGRWSDAVSPVRDGEVRRTPKGSLTGLLKQSVAGLVGQSQDPSSPGKGKRLSWFGLGTRRSPAPEEDAGPSSDGDIEGGARGSRVRGGSESSTTPGAAAQAMPGSTAEEFAVASQLLEGLYGKRLEASKAMEILNTVPEISWLVECYCMTPAQPGWRKSKTAPGDVPLYADEASGKVYEAMPCIRHYMRMAELSLTARKLPEKADAAAVQLHHHVQSLHKELKTAEAAWTGPHEDSESQGEYYHNPSTGVSIWENPTHCTSFILSVAEQLQDSDAFPSSLWKARRREDGGLPRRMGKAMEDPWTSLEKLEAMSGPSGATQDMDIEAFLGSLAQAPTSDPTSPSGSGPVQLVATSPKAPRLKDVRSWQPQVPRFDAGKLSAEANSTSRSPLKKREVPFRSEAQGSSEAKVGDVRGWSPAPVRFEATEMTSPTREGQLRTSAEGGRAAAEAAPVPPQVDELRASPEEAVAAPLPP